jgi:hypothetical protein
MYRTNKPLLSVIKLSNALLQSARGIRYVKHPRPLKTRKSGIDILHDPLWNKSLAFTYSERDRLGLRGLLPPTVRTLEGQVQRCMSHLRSCPDPVSKNLYLQDLHNRNETLYHRLLVDYVSSSCMCLPSYLQCI